MSYCLTIMEENGSIFTTLFLVGFFGGFTHCVGMCGPFVISQVTTKSQLINSSNMSELKRLSSGLLIPYHLGRMTTYTLLGSLGSAMVSAIHNSLLFHYLSAILLTIAGFIFIFSSLNLQYTSKPTLLKILPANWSKNLRAILSKMLGYFSEKPNNLKGYFLGFFLGFLPCGMVYGALAAAISASMGNILTGAFAMMFFAAGTIPALVVMGVGSHFFLRKWHKQFGYLARIVMMVSGITLLAMSYSSVF